MGPRTWQTCSGEVEYCTRERSSRVGPESKGSSSEGVEGGGKFLRMSRSGVGLGLGLGLEKRGTGITTTKKIDRKRDGGRRSLQAIRQWLEKNELEFGRWGENCTKKDCATQLERRGRGREDDAARQDPVSALYCAALAHGTETALGGTGKEIIH